MSSFANESSPAAITAEWEVIIDASRTYKITQYVSVAMVTLYVQYYLSTVPDEVGIWKNTGRKVPKVLFLMRSIGTSVLSAASYGFTVFNVTSECVSWFIAEVIILHHLFAIFSFMAFVLFVAGATVELASIHGTPSWQALSPMFGVCGYTQLNIVAPYLSCMPLMAFDLMLVLLFGGKTVHYHLNVMDTRWNGATLMKTLTRGAFMCYLWIFLPTLFAFTLLLTDKALLVLSYGPCYTIQPIAIGYLVIGLRRKVDYHVDENVSKYFGV
ncbi:hypothetical protein CONPUDRAFT_77742 [Coniophora puteana RWD-64-598 SS2]|uniref:Uncharacterized protein n=1 Tax=Coniophora puteana (strain RWD-64-598) TaxID=741705 RepID=A0A5M3M7S4_CONPW|nr:uncharacterized protein CONPUDRAFT_77742 [Coniophora puteana RWD-64-598 SS2]EIW74956.1 hypothetical protein CONPUDRAFT_77742 [Coniophora puteana RWD-64-598 SS2]